jgi:hypothetical protein
MYIQKIHGNIRANILSQMALSKEKKISWTHSNLYKNCRFVFFPYGHKTFVLGLQNHPTVTLYTLNSMVWLTIYLQPVQHTYSNQLELTQTTNIENMRKREDVLRAVTSLSTNLHLFSCSISVWILQKQLNTFSKDVRLQTHLRN